MDFRSPDYDYTDEMRIRDETLFQFNLLCHLADRPDEIHYFADQLRAANAFPI